MVLWACALTALAPPLWDDEPASEVDLILRVVDEETGSVWLISGEAISGPLEGSSLDRVEHLDTFWFSWSTYQPDTVLIEG